MRIYGVGDALEGLGQLGRGYFGGNAGNRIDDVIPGGRQIRIQFSETGLKGSLQSVDGSGVSNDTSLQGGGDQASLRLQSSGLAPDYRVDGGNLGVDATVKSTQGIVDQLDRILLVSQAGSHGSLNQVQFGWKACSGILDSSLYSRILQLKRSAERIQCLTDQRLLSRIRGKTL